MDTLTHALSGALLARASWHKSQAVSLKQRTQIGFLTAAFPDIDFVIRLFTDNFMVYLNYHRGITHSVLLLPLWALLLSLILSKLLRPSPHWKALFPVCCLGLGVHIAGDVITSYGTMIFSPLTDWRMSLDTTFILDPIFSAIIIFGLIGSYAFKHRQAIAATSFAVLICYVGLQSWAHQHARQIAEVESERHAWQESIVSVIPQPFSPLNWKLIVEHKEHYHVGLIRLFGNRHTATSDNFFDQLLAAYQPANAIEWSREDRYGYDRFDATSIKVAWQSDITTDFRRFTRYPALLKNHSADSTCHWFTDLRFIIPGRKNTPLFTYGICPNQRQLQQIH